MSAVLTRDTISLIGGHFFHADVVTLTLQARETMPVTSDAPLLVENEVMATLSMRNSDTPGCDRLRSPPSSILSSPCDEKQTVATLSTCNKDLPNLP